MQLAPFPQNACTPPRARGRAHGQSKIACSQGSVLWSSARGPARSRARALAADAMMVTPKTMVVMDPDANVDGADMRADNVGVGRARAQRRERKHGDDKRFHGAPLW